MNLFSPSTPKKDVYKRQGFHDRDDVLVEFAADIDGREQLGVAEQAGQLVGGEVHPDVYKRQAPLFPPWCSPPSVLP